LTQGPPPIPGAFLLRGPACRPGGPVALVALSPWWPPCRPGGPALTWWPCRPAPIRSDPDPAMIPYPIVRQQCILNRCILLLAGADEALAWLDIVHCGAYSVVILTTPVTTGPGGGVLLQGNAPGLHRNRAPPTTYSVPCNTAYDR
jgi:hypothetical protein